MIDVIRDEWSERQEKGLSHQQQSLEHATEGAVTSTAVAAWPRDAPSVQQGDVLSVSRPLFGTSCSEV